MAGNQWSGKPKLSPGAYGDCLITAQLNKLIAHPDPSTLPAPQSGAARLAWKLFWDALSEKNTAMKAMSEVCDRHEGKPVTPVFMEITRTPEDSVDAIFNSIAKIKESETDGAVN